MRPQCFVYKSSLVFRFNTYWCWQPDAPFFWSVLYIIESETCVKMSVLVILSLLTENWIICCEVTWLYEWSVRMQCHTYTTLPQVHCGAVWRPDSAWCIGQVFPLVTDNLIKSFLSKGYIIVNVFYTKIKNTFVLVFKTFFNDIFFSKAIWK